MNPSYVLFLICLVSSALALRANIPQLASPSLDTWLGTNQANRLEPLVDSKGIHIDIKAWIPRLREASEQGDPWAQGFLGHLLMEGNGIPQNVEQGFRLLRSSAGKHCLLAMQELGYRFLE